MELEAVFLGTVALMAMIIVFWGELTRPTESGTLRLLLVKVVLACIGGLLVLLGLSSV